MIQHTLTCAHCGEQFTTEYDTKLYCTKLCSGRASRARRQARQEPKPSTPHCKNCHGCKEQLTGQQSKWCSMKCRDRWRYWNDEGYRRNHNSRTSKASSERWAKKFGPAKPCPRCGREVLRRDSYYCNREDCQAPCIEEGCDLEGKTRGLCKSHYNKWWRETNPEEWQAQRARGRFKRRVLEESAYVEDVYRWEIMERDNWTCHLCTKKIPKDVEYPHPKYGSLDHLVPVSLGGEHSKRNIAAAHLRCNIIKGNRAAGEQLAIV